MPPAPPAWALAARDAAAAGLQHVASHPLVQSIAAHANGVAATPGAVGAAGAATVLISLASVQLLGDPRTAAGLTRVDIHVAAAQHAAPNTTANDDGHGHQHHGHASKAGHNGNDDPHHVEHHHHDATPAEDDHHNSAHASDHHDHSVDAPHGRATHAEDHDEHDEHHAADAASPLAPPPGLTQPGPGGRLPAIAPDGRMAADVYARPFPVDDARPRIALMVTGLGLSPTTTAEAIDVLPPEVTLAFSPYAADLQSWIDAARAAGHETVLALPMEPFDYPEDDPGPHVLLADSSAAELNRRLDWLMARATGYVAVTNHFGARFTTDGDATTRMLRALSARGVAFVYADVAARQRLSGLAAATRTRFAAADVLLDSRRAGRGLDEQFLRLEAGALRRGDAIGAFDARRGVVEAAARWTLGLDAKGYALAPISFVVRERAGRRGGRVEPTSVAAPAPPRFRVVKAGFGGRDEDGYGTDDHSDTGKKAHGDGH